MRALLALTVAHNAAMKCLTSLHFFRAAPKCFPNTYLHHYERDHFLRQIRQLEDALFESAAALRITDHFFVGEKPAQMGKWTEPSAHYLARSIAFSLRQTILMGFVESHQAIGRDCREAVCCKHVPPDTWIEGTWFHLCENLERFAWPDLSTLAVLVRLEYSRAVQAGKSRLLSQTQSAPVLEQALVPAPFCLDSVQVDSFSGKVQRLLLRAVNGKGHIPISEVLSAVYGTVNRDRLPGLLKAKDRLNATLTDMHCELRQEGETFVLRPI